jgi:hypothetical protein
VVVKHQPAAVAAERQPHDGVGVGGRGVAVPCAQHLSPQRLELRHVASERAAAHVVEAVRVLALRGTRACVRALLRGRACDARVSDVLADGVCKRTERHHARLTRHAAAVDKLVVATLEAWSPRRVRAWQAVLWAAHAERDAAADADGQRAVLLEEPAALSPGCETWPFEATD